MWEVSFKRSLRQLEGSQYDGLLSVLTNTFFCMDSKFSRIWRRSISEEFSAKSFYLALEGTLSHRAPSSLVWLGLVFLELRLFVG